MAGHIVLVGLPGAGKSTIGRLLAGRLRRPFVDFDVELRRREGLSVVELFALRGEAAFRKLEVALTVELAQTSPSVFAPGGGWITNSGVLALVRPPGSIIHLRVSPAGALKRLGSARASRPRCCAMHTAAAGMVEAAAVCSRMPLLSSSLSQLRFLAGKNDQTSRSRVF